MILRETNLLSLEPHQIEAKKAHDRGLSVGEMLPLQATDQTRFVGRHLSCVPRTTHLE